MRLRRCTYHHLWHKSWKPNSKKSRNLQMIWIMFPVIIRLVNWSFKDLEELLTTISMLKNWDKSKFKEISLSDSSKGNSCGLQISRKKILVANKLTTTSVRAQFKNNLSLRYHKLNKRIQRRRSHMISPSIYEKSRLIHQNSCFKIICMLILISNGLNKIPINILKVWKYPS